MSDVERRQGRVVVPTGGDSRIEATFSTDPDYPGVWVEFFSNESDDWDYIRPQVLFEMVEETRELRVLIWADPDREDYSEEVVFDLERFKKKNRKAIEDMRKEREER